MTRQNKASNRSIEIVKQVIMAHHKLFVDSYLTDSTETQAILHQMMHGKPQHKSIMLYQYFLEAFLHSGGGDRSNQNYYHNQKYKPSFNRIKNAVKTAQCPKLASFETFKGCGYRKMTNNCSEPAFVKSCPLPRFDMKRGPLNEMAFSLYFFLRDVCRGNFYAYVRGHFGEGQLADEAVSELLQSFIEKITTIANVSPK